MQEWHTLTNFDHLGEWERLLSVKTEPTHAWTTFPLPTKQTKMRSGSFFHSALWGQKSIIINNNIIFFSFSFLALNIHWITSHRGSLFSKKIWPSFFQSCADKFSLYLHFIYLDSCAEDIFLKRMRNYMLPKHRAFIEAVEQGPSIRNFGKMVVTIAFWLSSIFILFWFEREL